MSTKVRLFCLATQLQLINALNIIDDQKIEKKNLFCLLVDRINTKETIERLNSLNLFENIFSANWERPYLKDWIRNPALRNNYTLLDISRGTLSTNRTLTFKKIIQEKYRNIIEIVSACDEIYFHNDKLFFKLLFSYAPNRCSYHLIDEGTRSYLSQSIAWHHDFIHLYDPDLICFKNENSNIIPIKKISTKRSRLLSWIKTIYPPEPIPDTRIIFFSQPLGKKPRPILSHFLRRYRESAQKYYACINIIKSLPKNTNEKICIRRHPADNLNLKEYLPPNKFIFSSGSKTPFEISLFFETHTPQIFYTIYSTAACYWKLMFSDEQTQRLDIKTYILLNRYLSYKINDNNKNVYYFFQKLAIKYPNNFFMD